MSQHRADVAAVLPPRAELFLYVCALGFTVLSLVFAALAYAGVVPAWTTWAVFCAVVLTVGAIVAIHSVRGLRARR